ncbi:hypothetical protein J6590_078142 [Homalodisca vitripennis]|nr:hypothetical protein J6590_078142 [Homalodisca vitripennis]
MKRHLNQDHGGGWELFFVCCDVEYSCRQHRYALKQAKTHFAEAHQGPDFLLPEEELGICESSYKALQEKIIRLATPARPASADSSTSSIIQYPSAPSPPLVPARSAAATARKALRRRRVAEDIPGSPPPGSLAALADGLTAWQREWVARFPRGMVWEVFLCSVGDLVASVSTAPAQPGGDRLAPRAGHTAGCFQAPDQRESAAGCPDAREAVRIQDTEAGYPGDTAACSTQLRRRRPSPLEVAALLRRTFNTAPGSDRIRYGVWMRRDPTGHVLAAQNSLLPRRYRRPSSSTRKGLLRISITGGPLPSLILAGRCSAVSLLLVSRVGPQPMGFCQEPRRTSCLLRAVLSTTSCFRSSLMRLGDAAMSSSWPGLSWPTHSEVSPTPLSLLRCALLGLPPTNCGSLRISMSAV